MIAYCACTQNNKDMHILECTKLKKEIKRKTENKIKYGKLYNDKIDIKIWFTNR